MRAILSGIPGDFDLSWLLIRYGVQEFCADVCFGDTPFALPLPRLVGWEECRIFYIPE